MPSASERAAATFMPSSLPRTSLYFPRSTAPDIIASSFEAASFALSASISRFSSFTSAMTAAPRFGSSPTFCAFISRAVSASRASFSRSCFSDSRPVTHSMRRTPAATEDSLTMWKSPIFAVLSTCVPPQNSVEASPIFTTRTILPYFSPKSIIAPIFFASSISVTTVSTGMPSRIFSFTRSSTRRSSSGSTAEK